MPTPLFKDKYTLRYLLIVFTLIGLFIPIFFRLYMLQIGDVEKLKDLANRQHYVKRDIPSQRGKIFDRNMKVLATSLKVPSIYAVPRLIPQSDFPEITNQLASILEIDRKILSDRLQRDKAFVWLRRRVDKDMSDKVKALDKKYLGVTYEKKRFYPESNVCSNVVGVCNVDDQGIGGLELQYDRILSGVPGHQLTKRDAKGRQLEAFKEETNPPIDGHNLVLTIDHFIQFTVEKYLRESFEKWKAKSATCIVMDPHTGEVLAMVSLPNYDPNNMGADFREGKRNRAVVDYYEPGSIFKIVTAAGVFEEGLVNEDDNFFCENGKFQFTRSRVLKDAHPYGDLNFREVITKSSNIGTVKAAMKLGEEKLYRYIRKFGFGDVTGIDFPGEVGGVVRPVSRWSGYSISSIPIGQEVTVTPLQMAVAMSVIANGGYRVKPYLLSKVIDTKGIVIEEYKTKIKERVIEEDTALRMASLLKEVVETGTGRNAQIEGITTAGKTGTAQKIADNKKGYSHSKFISSWVGFAPVEDPKIVVSVMVDEAKPAYYGGTVAAPVFREVVKEVLFYLNYVNPEEAFKNSPNGRSHGVTV